MQQQQQQKKKQWNKSQQNQSLELIETHQKESRARVSEDGRIPAAHIN